MIENKSSLNLNSTKEYVKKNRKIINEWLASVYRQLSDSLRILSGKSIFLINLRLIAIILPGFSYLFPLCGIG